LPHSALKSIGLEICDLRRAADHIALMLVVAWFGVVRAPAAEVAAPPRDQAPAPAPPGQDAPPASAVTDAQAAQPPSSDPKRTAPDAAPASPSSARDAPPTFAETLCKELGWAALNNGLPAEFLVRLIWQESRFDSHSVSPKGAEGIAQFMPGTARWRGLADPFEPIEALRQSARWLKELRAQFGNLGLAAAAYNAGPRRVQDWLDGRGRLPGETRDYVKIITGRSAEDWVKLGSDAESKRFALGDVIPCNDIAKVMARYPPPPPQQAAATNGNAAGAAWGPWGLQLTGNWSEARALADYQDLQKKFPAVLGDRAPLVLRGAMAGRGSAPWYRVRVAESTHERAAELCARLERAGGKCLVFRN
jgi:soluble lytic murein transglycosylase-like protein